MLDPTVLFTDVLVKTEMLLVAVNEFFYKINELHTALKISQRTVDISKE